MRSIMVGNVQIGGSGTIPIQSMCNTSTADIGATVNQIKRLEQAGCDIVRLAVPDAEAAAAIKEIKSLCSIPLVADIHFDYRLAITCVENGIDKIRINPGNIGSEEKVRAVSDICKSRNIPIRVGVNGGSIDINVRRKHGVTPVTLCDAAEMNIEMLERWGFEDICISLKASDVFTTIRAYRAMAQRRDYPLHLGVTEAGASEMGTIKSAAAFGALLEQGIGNTIRVSLTADPVEEVHAAKKILLALGLNRSGVNIISCPTCGRTQVDLIAIEKQVRQRLLNVQEKITVAVMGCAVNGPGEAEEADFGIACGKGEGLIFKKGKIIGKASEDMLVDELIKQMDIHRVC